MIWNRLQQVTFCIQLIIIQLFLWLHLYLFHSSTFFTFHSVFWILIHHTALSLSPLSFSITIWFFLWSFPSYSVQVFCSLLSHLTIFPFPSTLSIWLHVHCTSRHFLIISFRFLWLVFDFNLGFLHSHLPHLTPFPYHFIQIPLTCLWLLWQPHCFTQYRFLILSSDSSISNVCPSILSVCSSSGQVCFAHCYLSRYISVINDQCLGETWQNLQPTTLNHSSCHWCSIYFWVIDVKMTNYDKILIHKT